MTSTATATATAPATGTFSVSHARDAVFDQGLRAFFAYRDLGIRQATGGRVVAHVIRAMPGAVAQTPIVVLTADVMNEACDQAMAAGANDFISKPVKVEQPSVEDAIAILTGLKSKYEDHHKAEFTSDAPMHCEGLTQVFTKPSALTGVIFEFIERGTFGFCKENVKALMESTKGS